MNARSQDGSTAVDFLIQEVIQSTIGLSGRRLIAPKGTIVVKNDYPELVSNVSGGFPRCEIYYDVARDCAYSVDMVRLEFDCVDERELLRVLDTNQVFYYVDTYTSNRIGTYRYMWVYSYADAEEDPGVLEHENGTVEFVLDGSKNSKVAVGYGLVGKGGLEKRGFIEFNPNKVEKLAVRLMREIYDAGSDFELLRYDLAIDCGVERNLIRLLRDRRYYEYCISRGGPTEYMGSRNRPGRVKVYDKAAETGGKGDLTRIELTCSADWGIDEILEKLPKCVDYSNLSGFNGRSLTARAFASLLSDVMSDAETFGMIDGLRERCVPERYLQMLSKNTMYRTRKSIVESEKYVKYSRSGIRHCVKRARAFAEMMAKF